MLCNLARKSEVNYNKEMFSAQKGLKMTASYWRKEKSISGQNTFKNTINDAVTSRSLHPIRRFERDQYWSYSPSKNSCFAQFWLAEN